MATVQLTQEETWSERLGSVREFLARFGIAPRPVHDYIEEDVIKAIRAHGWEPMIECELAFDEWRAEIREWRAVTQSRACVANDEDRILALLRALRLAIDWPTREEETARFDALARDLLGIGGIELLSRWHNDELDLDDPRVVHLLIARPLSSE